jgi:polyhydroxyalkanoate synthesis regulator phasin
MSVLLQELYQFDLDDHTSEFESLLDKLPLSDFEKQDIVDVVVDMIACQQSRIDRLEEKVERLKGDVRDL